MSQVESLETGPSSPISTSTDSAFPLDMASPSLPIRPAVRDLSNLLDTTWRVSLKDDKRIFTGKFLVVDKRKNLILDETVEELDGRTRNVGLIMLPGDRILSAQVDRDTILI